MDANQLAEALSARFRIGLLGESVATKEGSRPAVRATDIPAPNGFTIQVVSGWKSIEADFVPDTYAGDLIRAMGNSAPQARDVFSSLAKVFEGMGNHIVMRVNGSIVGDLSALPASPWNKFELNLRQLTDLAASGADVQLKSAEEIAAACLALILTLLPLEEEATGALPLYESGLPEGACTKVTVNRYERSPVNRAACIAAHGAVCKACGFDFGVVYGVLGHGYIEVHHRIPVSKMGDGYAIDPIRDLVPLCANCHAAVHRTDPPLKIEVLTEIIEQNRV